jgi:hypothetical protein
MGEWANGRMGEWANGRYIRLSDTVSCEAVAQDQPSIVSKNVSLVVVRALVGR